MTDHEKIVPSDYVGDPYGFAKFSANPSKVSLGQRMNYKGFFLFILFFGNSPTGQICRQIFTLDGLNDADSRNGVPFRGFVDIDPHIGGEIPPPQKENTITGRE